MKSPPPLHAAIMVILAVSAALLIRQYFFLVTKVSSLSMYPSLQQNQWLLTKRLHASSKVKRREIIIFHSPEWKQVLVKRVIGLPGDVVDIRANGTVSINQQLLEEPYVESHGGQNGTFVVPKGTYFVLGDQRTISTDSRHFADPYIPKKDILGKAFFSLYPFHRLKKSI